MRKHVIHVEAVHLPTIHSKDAAKIANGLECWYKAVYHKYCASKDGPPEGLVHSHGLENEPATTDLSNASKKEQKDGQQG